MLTMLITVEIVVVVVVVVVVVGRRRKMLKGADFQQSHCAKNCPQHVHSTGQGAIVCKSRAV